MCQASCWKVLLCSTSSVTGSPAPRGLAQLPGRSCPGARARPLLELAHRGGPAFEGQRCTPAPAAVPVGFCPAGAVAGPLPGRDPAGCALHSAELREHRPCPGRRSRSQQSSAKMSPPLLPLHPAGGQHTLHFSEQSY